MDHGASLVAAFDAESEIVEEIVRDGMGNYVKRLPDLAKITKLDDRHIRCMDGRTPGGLRLPGSGILLEDNIDRSVEIAVEFARKANATAITYHEDCGAVEGYLKAHGIKVNRDNPPIVFARNFAKKVADASKLPCFETPLRGEVGSHLERAVYYTKVDIDPSKEKGLPSGFVISRKYLRNGYALAALATSLQIAFGEHGFGQLFKGKQPFLVVLVAQTEDQLDQLKEEVQATVATYDGKVRVDGFVI